MSKCSCLAMHTVFCSENKYAIYAYTHGPVTGSGSLLVELRVPPPPSSLLPYSANVKLTAAYRRWP